MTVTVRAMSAEPRVRADHGHYIRAVCRSIEARDIVVAGRDIGTSGEYRRMASLTLRPVQEEFAGTVPAEAQACWDEENGWSLRTRSGPAGSWISKGLAVLPDPDDVAAWVVVALTHPELTPSYEQGPLRRHGVPDPDFEARLAGYPATA